MKKTRSGQSAQRRPLSRRRFLHRSSVAGAALATQFQVASRVLGQSRKRIRVGVIGCGGRGTGATLNILQAETRVIYPPPNGGYHTENPAPGARVRAQNVEIVALADLFRDRLEDCRTQLRKVGVEVSEKNCFVGFQAYRQLLDLKEVDYVILATPPQFRPREFRAAVEAGKHVFMEKPIAVDAPGVRSVIESGKMARSKGLGVAAGTQRRHQADIVETVRRLQDNVIGQILEARAYFNVGEIWMIPPESGKEEEWHFRNWNYFTWLSGDIIVEQHIHMLDQINWILGEHPSRAYGVGGRISRTSDDFGHTYDHFAIEYEYPSGARLFSQNRQIANCQSRIAAAVLGERGTSNCANQIHGVHDWSFEGKVPNPYEQEHIDLIRSIHEENPIDETQSVAEATLTAIMGREAAYSGKVIEWDAALSSERSYTPDRYNFSREPVPEVVNPKSYRFY